MAATMGKFSAALNGQQLAIDTARLSNRATELGILGRQDLIALRGQQGMFLPLVAAILSLWAPHVGIFDEGYHQARRTLDFELSSFIVPPH